MKELIKQILEKLACKHHWIEFREIKVDSTFGHYHIWHFNCDKCGKFKRIKSS
jgi:hypothetical protein